MRNQDNVRTGNFWVGFAAGMSVAAVAAYLFGTKQGRSMLLKSVNFSENIDHNLEKVLGELSRKQKTSKKSENASPTPFDGLGVLIDKIRAATNRA